ncbi:MAG: cytidine deaminase [Clostridia bacterium]|nr:cytidine deaminase [Clostridia bacterium]
MGAQVEIESAFPAPAEALALIRAAADAALAAEGIKNAVSCHVLVTDDEGIRGFNLSYRGLDKATDVLSFPSLPFTPENTAASHPEWLDMEYDVDTGTVFLGDIIISWPRVLAQAEEYGHSTARETAYLMTHAMFHLMGYDHMEKEDQRRMRQMEESSIARFLPSQEEEKMLSMAREAMKMAYVPYSHYPVGACLKCTDGTLYTGCNVENASFGATNCAERTAIFKAVSEGRRSFESIAIAAGPSAPWPCGICRQVMNEFSPGMRVMVTWDGGYDAMPLSDLLPHGFGPESLDK